MKKWKVLSPKQDFSSSEEIIQELYSIRNISDVEKFTNSNLFDLDIDKSGILLTEVNKTIERLELAFKKNQKIVILGDYDVDGICASAILWETIYKIYKNIYPYIPDRFSEGYGLSETSLSNLIEKYPDVRLIITVDNGIVAHSAVKIANTRGIDVIVTDHHVPSSTPPDAYSIVHTTNLCGAGVAWMLAKKINEKILNEARNTDHLELAALATVADLVPLTNLNRDIVKLGIDELRKTKRVGLLELFKVANIDQNKIDTYHIGYMIGPRLNASGRIAHGIDSLRLICSGDKKFAESTARALEETNRQRQQMVIKSSDHAKLSVVALPKLGKVITVHDESYSEGVVGLIASKLVEEYARPSIAIAIGASISKGSARSISGVNIIEILRSMSHVLKDAGGHPMAAGFSLETSKIEMFYEELEKASEIIDESLFGKEIKIDMEIPFSLVTQELYKDIQRLSPFGMGNHQPVFMTKSAEIVDRKNLGKNNTHMKLRLFADGVELDAIGFDMAETIDAHINDKVDIAYTIDINEWKNRKTLQLKLKDLKTLDH